MEENKITYFGETDSRNKKVKFGIKAKDRTRHVYVIGKTGMGKSTLLENMAVQDIQGGDGMCFIDPHGKSADLLLEYVPKDRIRDVIYIAPFDVDHPISFNVLESVDPTKRHLVVSGLMSTFKKIWVDAWSARMEYILTNTLLALLEAPNTTLLGVNRMLSDKAYRNEIITHITDPSVRSFWVKEFAGYTERMAAEAVPAIQNKVGQFTANPLIRNMIGQSVSSFDFRDAMDKRKILIINLSKGKIGDENMKLLGGLLVTKIYLAAMSRADVPDRVMKMLPNFYLFVDEFQNFANASFADILSEARKYKLNLTIAHQYVEQMDEFVRPAVFGNVGTMIVFRIGANDAELLENEFAPQFTVEDLVNLGQYQMYLKLMIDGLTSSPFSARNLPPIAHPDDTYVQEIISASREQFAKPRAEVEAEIVRFHEPTVVAKPAPNPAAAAPAAAQGSGAAPGSAGKASSGTQSPSTPIPRPSVSAAASSRPSQSVVKPLIGHVTGSEMPASALPASSVIPKPMAAPTAPVSAPKPAPKPEATHKPFANLKEVLAEVTAKPLVPPPVPTVKVEPKPEAQPVPMPVPVKPVSLSSLAQKPQPKIDPKVPTQKNVSDLKNALAAVLGNKAPSSPAATIPAAPAVPSKPPSVPVPPPVPQKIPQKPVDPALSSEQPKPSMREVPEDVLKKVLKVD